MHRLRKTIVAVALGTIAAVTVSGWAPTTASAANGSQPDLMIREPSVSPVWEGDGIYNTDGAGQAVATGGYPGFKATIEVRVGNDGPTTDTFRVRAPMSDDRVAFRYTLNGTKITKQLRDAGSYDVKIGGWGSVLLTVVVKIKSGTPPGLHRSALVRARSTSAGAKDAAEILVFTPDA